MAHLLKTNDALSAIYLDPTLHCGGGGGGALEHAGQDPGASMNGSQLLSPAKSTPSSRAPSHSPMARQARSVGP